MTATKRPVPSGPAAAPAGAAGPQLRAVPGKVKVRVKPRHPSWIESHSSHFGTGVSVVLHLFLIFALSFAVPEINLTRQQDRGLDIVLVNAKHARKPKDAQALAQNNLDGGGNVEERVRTTSPLPPENTDKPGDALIEAQRRVQDLEQRQRELMTAAKSATSLPSQASQQAEQSQEPPAPSRGLALTESARAMARQQAVVERRVQEYAQRPRKAFVGARTEEYRFAQYVEDWREKVQRIGTLNYPAGPQGRLYGSLLINVEINSQGDIVAMEILRSSKDKRLDEAAMRILHLAAPFARFPPNIAKDVDILSISRTWIFANDRVVTE